LPLDWCLDDIEQKPAELAESDTHIINDDEQRVRLFVLITNCHPLSDSCFDSVEQEHAGSGKRIINDDEYCVRLYLLWSETTLNLTLG
jgi:hypothetical protein